MKTPYSLESQNFKWQTLVATEKDGMLLTVGPQTLFIIPLENHAKIYKTKELSSHPSTEQVFVTL